MPGKLKLAIEKYAVSPQKIEHLVSILPPMPGGGPPVALQFIMQLQIQSQWCWAATATSVSLFYNGLSHWTQCLLAGSALSLTCCPSPGPCNKPWYLDRALSITGNFTNYKGPISFSDVEAELLAGRVIGCRIGWKGGGGHFVAIYGCYTIGATNYFSVDDPITGKANISETGFLTAYQGTGAWTHTFITKP